MESTGYKLLTMRAVASSRTDKQRKPYPHTPISVRPIDAGCVVPADSELQGTVYLPIGKLLLLQCCLISPTVCQAL